MPRYTSPSPATSRSSSPSGPRRSRSAQPARHRRRRSPTPEGRTHKDALKTSLVFLGAVGAASLVAQKYWPKGFIYGEAEHFEEKAKKKVNQIKHAVLGDSHDDERERGRRRKSTHEPDYYSEDDRYRECGGHRQKSRLELEGLMGTSLPPGRHRYAEGDRGRHHGDGAGRRSRHVDDDRYELRDMRYTERQAPRPRRYMSGDDSY
ncbi:Uu.00g079020.m01.CDS01 [Anthostomella pinea]|uniref:Uu.00g079020.m01.CDS01 n=1 Tax=Anthostomella pinea TaxID=933095 RepID=A0AAI8VLP0_9PEZI|nr:Uu.00g079020.m01.CDS01 [Anthostomella pinea]